jgi:multicomponent Na+:H+ antiporter subunit B
MILHAIVFGLEATRRLVPERVVEVMIALGVLIYAGVGVEGLLLGGNFLDYFVLSHNPVSGQHLGILLVEIGVCITVAGVMLMIFYLFAGRGRRPGREP